MRRALRNARTMLWPEVDGALVGLVCMVQEIYISLISWLAGLQRLQRETNECLRLRAALPLLGFSLKILGFLIWPWDTGFLRRPWLFSVFKCSWVFLGIFHISLENTFLPVVSLPKSKKLVVVICGFWPKRMQIWKSELLTKKGHQKFCRIKDTFFGKSWFFREKVGIFQEISANCIEIWPWVVLVFFAHLGIFIFLEWQHWLRGYRVADAGYMASPAVHNFFTSAFT